MAEGEKGKSGIVGNAGLVTVLAAGISAVAAIAVAYIQKGGSEKTPEPAVSVAQTSGVGGAAPVYVTKLVNGKMVRVLVRGVPGAAGPAGAAGAAETAGEPGGAPAAQADAGGGGSAREAVPAAEEQPPADVPAEEHAADGNGDGEAP